jgi:hypothetical protein
MLMYCICLEGKSHSQSFVKEKKRIMFLFDFFLCTFLPKHAYGKGMLELFFTISWRSVLLVEETEGPGENHAQTSRKTLTNYHLMSYSSI